MGKVHDECKHWVAANIKKIVFATKHCPSCKTFVSGIDVRDGASIVEKHIPGTNYRADVLVLLERDCSVAIEIAHTHFISAEKMFKCREAGNTVYEVRTEDVLCAIANHSSVSNHVLPITCVESVLCSTCSTNIETDNVVLLQKHLYGYTHKRVKRVKRVPIVSEHSDAQILSLEKFALSELYNVPISSIDPGFVKKYNNAYAKRVYACQMSIRSYGGDAQSAIDTMKVVQANSAVIAFGLKRKRGDKFIEKNCMQASKDNIYLREWHEHSTEEYHKHEILQDLLGVVTGLPGLHVLDRQGTVFSQLDIHKQLGYLPPVPGPNGGKPKGKQKGSHASPIVMEKLRALYKDIKRYMPNYNIKPLGDTLTMMRAVHILDSLLSSLYGCSFQRIEEEDEFGKTVKTNNYILRQSTLFDAKSVVTMPSFVPYGIPGEVVVVDEALHHDFSIPQPISVH
jgi:hypothetical protein